MLKKIKSEIRVRYYEVLLYVIHITSEYYYNLIINFLISSLSMLTYGWWKASHMLYIRFCWRKKVKFIQL